MISSAEVSTEQFMAVFADFARAGKTLREVMRGMRAIYVEAALKEAKGNKSHAARLLNTHRNTIYRNQAKRRKNGKLRN